MNVDLKKYPLDQEMQAFLEKSEEIYPPNNGALAVEENRRLYLKMCESFQAPIPDGIIITDHEIPGRHGPVPIRIYEHQDHRSAVTVLYLHGGGFVVGDLDTHNSICAELSARCGHRLVAVDYRLAPEHVHPVQFEDALDVYLAIDQGHTVLVGDSAGANLAAAICVAQHGSDRQPVGQVLIYPWLGGELYDLESYVSNADAPGLTAKDIEDYRQLRCGGEPHLHDPVYYPLALKEYADLPPCVAFAAEFDPIRDDAVEWVNRLKNAGVEATCHYESGLIHSYLRARHCSKKASASFDRICEAVADLGEIR
jgi:acetyl esterase